MHELIFLFGVLLLIAKLRSLEERSDVRARARMAGWKIESLQIVAMCAPTYWPADHASRISQLISPKGRAWWLVKFHDPLAGLYYPPKN